MKATINKNDILPVLSKIQGLAGRKTSLAITTNGMIQMGLSQVQQDKPIIQLTQTIIM